MQKQRKNKIFSLKQNVIKKIFPEKKNLPMIIYYQLKEHQVYISRLESFYFVNFFTFTSFN